MTAAKPKQYERVQLTAAALEDLDRIDERSVEAVKQIFRHVRRLDDGEIPASDEITSAVAADPTSFPTIMVNPRVNQVRLQIRVMRAEHAMFADLTRRTIDFLDRFNPNPST